MTAQDAFILFMRWAHALAALLWIGGALFYALVLRSVAQSAREPQVARFNQAVAREFAGWVHLCIGVLVVSGAALTVTRLTSGSATLPYIVVLAVKVSLALIAFLLVRAQRRRSPPSPTPAAASSASGALFATWSRRARVGALLSGVNLIVALGIAVFLLADVLRYLAEGSLQGV